MEDLKRLNPRTALVILGGALARRKVLDRAKLGVVLFLSWATTLLFPTQAEAQQCYTVRDSQGTVVYQSLKPPVDTELPYKDEIEALFPGGYMSIERNYFRCGSYERSVPVAPAAPKTEPFDCATNTFAQFVPECNKRAASQPVVDAPGGIFKGLAKDGLAPVGEPPRVNPSSSPPAPPTAASPDWVEWGIVALVWGVIGLVAFAMLVTVNGVNEGHITGFALLTSLLRAVRIFLALVLITQAWTYFEAFMFAKDNPDVLQRLEFIVPAVVKTMWVTAIVLLFDYLRRRINAAHKRKFGVPHPSLKTRWSL